jgi:hypothetical protein
MTNPTQEERRAAIAVALRILDESEPMMFDVGECVLVCRVLLAAQQAFVERLAPVYAAAQALVRDDGSQDAKAWSAFKDVVLRCRAYDSRTIEPHEPQTGAGR